MEGTCRYCRQMMTVPKTCSTEEEANEYATLNCSCEAAEQYRKRQMQEQNTVNRVEELFGLNSGVSTGEEALLWMKQAAVLICRSGIAKASITIWPGTKMTITRTKKGNVKVERELKQIETHEE